MTLDGIDERGVPDGIETEFGLDSAGQSLEFVELGQLTFIQIDVHSVDPRVLGSGKDSSILEKRDQLLSVIFGKETRIKPGESITFGENLRVGLVRADERRRCEPD